MNPWVSIWLQPRQTIRQILDTNPKRFVLLLAIGAGVADVLMQSLPAVSQSKIPLVAGLLIGLVGGALFGVFVLYLFGWLYRWTGSWLGGQATAVETRAAIAWTQVPSVWLFGLWLALLVASGGDLLKATQKQAGMTPVAAIFSILFGLASIVIGIWQFVIVCRGIAEVHRFSGWKGFGTVVITQSLFLVPIFILGIIAAIAVPNFIRARDAARARIGGVPAPSAVMNTKGP